MRQFIEKINIFICIIAIYSLGTNALAVSSLSQENRKVESFNITDERNTVYNIKNFEDQLVILYFWASWCLECVDELKQLNQLKEKLLYHNIRNIEIIPISTDFKDASFIEDLYIDNNINNLGLFFDYKKEATRILNIKTIPTSVILNKELVEIARCNKTRQWTSKEDLQYINNLIQDLNLGQNKLN